MPLIRRHGAPALPNCGVPLYLYLRLLTRNYQILQGNIYENGLILLAGTPQTDPTGEAPLCSQILGFPPFIFAVFHAE